MFRLERCVQPLCEWQRLCWTGVPRNSVLQGREEGCSQLHRAVCSFARAVAVWKALRVRLGFVWMLAALSTCSQDLAKEHSFTVLGNFLLASIACDDHDVPGWQVDGTEAGSGRVHALGQWAAYMPGHGSGDRGATGHAGHAGARRAALGAGAECVGFWGFKVVRHCDPCWPCWRASGGAEEQVRGMQGIGYKGLQAWWGCTPRWPCWRDGRRWEQVRGMQGVGF